MSKRERKYSHPFNTPDKPFDGFDVKLWEIRNQLEINIELMMQSHPEPEISMHIFGEHSLETLTRHAFDRIDELEKMIKELQDER